MHEGMGRHLSRRRGMALGPEVDALSHRKHRKQWATPPRGGSAGTGHKRTPGQSTWVSSLLGPQQSHGDCLSLPSEKGRAMLPSTAWCFLGIIRRGKSPGQRVLGSGFQLRLQTTCCVTRASLPAPGPLLSSKRGG